MISDPAHIKRDLAASLAGLEDLLLDWTAEESDLRGVDVWDDPWEEEESLENALLVVEQFVFWAAFSIRKLIEGQALSDEFEALQLAARVHPRTSDESPEDLLSARHVERFYDLSTSHPQRLSPKELCNQLVHSFQFLPVTDEPQRRLVGLLFNSDRSRRDGLFFMRWSEFERFTVAATEDEVNYLHVDRRSGRVSKLRDVPPEREID